MQIVLCTFLSFLLLFKDAAPPPKSWAISAEILKIRINNPLNLLKKRTRAAKSFLSKKRSSFCVAAIYYCIHFIEIYTTNKNPSSCPFETKNMPLYHKEMMIKEGITGWEISLDHGQHKRYSLWKKILHILFCLIGKANSNLGNTSLSNVCYRVAATSVNIPQWVIDWGTTNTL